MQKRLIPFVITLLAATAAPLSAQDRFVQLMGWGGGAPEKIVPKAAAVGFTDIIVWSDDLEYLGRLVTAAREHDIAVYSSLSLSHVKRWQKRYPEQAPPLQVMNETENRALERIRDDKSPGRSNYQSGGEPVQDCEVLLADLLCFHNRAVVDFYEAEIEHLLSVPGLAGIGFDYFGYRNYTCCRCEHSRRLLDAYRKQHPELSAEDALVRFSLSTLVAFNNELADYARTLRPGVKIVSHVYPVFLPEPLYGNRLDVDICGQTAAWFFEPFWSYEKIRDYSEVIFGREKAYHQRAEGAGLIGIYNKPGKFSVKPIERIARELQAILDGGGDRVQVCSMNDVLESAEISAVFRRFRGKAETP